MRRPVDRVSPFQFPAIEDSDVQWAAEILKLPDAAFAGAHGNDPRLHVLKNPGSIDIEACPGSGKTTLLTAKLAVISRRWKDSRRGICILSHTNAARREIEQRLGSTPEGRRLLGFPHYVGTIHGFVNTYLSIPWLRSLGYPVTAIDDDQCEQVRRRLLKLAQHGALRTFVEGKENSPHVNVVGEWHVANAAFDVLKENGTSHFADLTKSAPRQLIALAKLCAEKGYHRYSEMFMWAHDLLDKCPGTAISLRQRFPVVFIDEVQDNNEAQSRILHRIFVEGDSAVIRQRYGDSNQAIYGYVGDGGASTDIFPIAAARVTIPNSHRFGQPIADLANPFGLVPYNLQGVGPSQEFAQSNTHDRNAIFLFSNQNIGRVFDAYGGYLSECFTQGELDRGVFKIVGGIHRPGPDDNLPRSVGNYWPIYDPEISLAEPKPKTFFQYVMASHKVLAESGESHQAVERIAEALARLVALAGANLPLTNGRSRHRQLLRMLADDQTARLAYSNVVVRFMEFPEVPSFDIWNTELRPTILATVAALTGNVVDENLVEAFLEWPGPQPPAGEAVAGVLKKPDNIFRYAFGQTEIRIGVGSIHSVKGETHTATLVLETYFHGHQLIALKPWLLGNKSGKGQEGPRNQSRLKQHFVAMTRPTHLLCLAMKDNLSPDEIEVLKGRAWRVGRVTENGTIWL